MSSSPPPPTVMFNNLMSNIGTLGGSSYGTSGSAMSTMVGGKRIPIAMEKITSQEEAEDKEALSVLHKDFETLAGMTLLDDEINLDTVFIRQKSMAQMPYAFNLLINLYKIKYADLLARYPSIHVWLSFCLVSLIFGNENRLRAQCNDASMSCVPVLGSSHDAFNPINRKRSRFSRAENTKKGEKKARVGTTTEGAAKLQKPPHPFLQSDYYLAHPSLFKIGSMTKYCVPTDFATRFVTIKAGPVTKIVTKNEKHTFNGLRGMFTRTIVALLTIRRIQNYPFVSVPFMEGIGQLVAKMSGFTPEVEIFSLGVRQNMTVEDLIVHTTTSYADEKIEMDASTMVVLLTNFQCVGTRAQTVDIRSYTSNIYKINVPRLHISDADIRGIEEQNSASEDDYSRILEEYDDKLSELGIERVVAPENGGDNDDDIIAEDTQQRENTNDDNIDTAE